MAGTLSATITKKKYLGGGGDGVTERLAEIDDGTADSPVRSEPCWRSLEDYDLDEEDRALLVPGASTLRKERAAGRPGGGGVGPPERGQVDHHQLRILGRREDWWRISRA